MKKVPVTTIMICISWYSITSFAKVEVSIPQSDIITCERTRYVEVSKSKSSDQTEESKKLDLVIYNEDSEFHFRQGDGLWHLEPTIKNDKYEMVSEHFWFDKETRYLSFIVRGSPNTSTSFRWYKCH